MLKPLATFLLAAAAAAPALAAPVPQGPPNAPWQTPAFPGQTRVDEVVSNVAYNVTTVASGLQNPWGIDFLPDGRPVVTEKPGRIRVVQPDGSLLTVKGAPSVVAQGQGGLLDVLVIRGATPKLCVTYAEPVTGGLSRTAARCGKLYVKSSGVTVGSGGIVWRQSPAHSGNGHYGSRIVVAPDGTLYITAGERQDVPIRNSAQDPATGIGKTVHVNYSGSAAAGNPTWGGSSPSRIWSMGHRNPQGAAIHPVTGKLWTVEHGARGGDELNVPLGGRNYGWPIVTYGIDYNGQPIGAGITQQAGIEQPVYYWDPVIAPGGMNFYTGSLFPRWQGNLFIASLGRGQLVRLELDGERVTGEERLDLGERIRDVAQGPDGAIYAITDSANGRVLKLTPR